MRLRLTIAVTITRPLPEPKALSAAHLIGHFNNPPAAAHGNTGVGEASAVVHALVNCGRSGRINHASAEAIRGETVHLARRVRADSDPRPVLEAGIGAVYVQGAA